MDGLIIHMKKYVSCVECQFTTRAGVFGKYHCDSHRINCTTYPWPTQLTKTNASTHQINIFIRFVPWASGTAIWREQSGTSSIGMNESLASSQRPSPSSSYKDFVGGKQLNPIVRSLSPRSSRVLLMDQKLPHFVHLLCVRPSATMRLRTGSRMTTLLERRNRSSFLSNFELVYSRVIAVLATGIFQSTSLVTDINKLDLKKLDWE